MRVLTNHSIAAVYRLMQLNLECLRCHSSLCVLWKRTIRWCGLRLLLDGVFQVSCSDQCHAHSYQESCDIKLIEEDKSAEGAHSTVVASRFALGLTALGVLRTPLSETYRPELSGFSTINIYRANDDKLATFASTNCISISKMTLLVLCTNASESLP